MEIEKSAALAGPLPWDTKTTTKATTITAAAAKPPYISPFRCFLCEPLLAAADTRRLDLLLDIGGTP